ncbi:MAG: methyltransferase domain-containing protein [Acidimicrobiia bacterium]|nr:methyltransferase domain-containing protein [Acidimicrobiia bacterium]
MIEPSEHVAENRRYWDGRAPEWVAMGERAWAAEPTWGQWGVPDDDVTLLPEEMTGMDAIELGCGTGYVSAWMVRRGATVTAIDNSERQLATAALLASRHGIELELIHGNAETVPKPDESYDFAVSEYGAAIWADPDLWIPEAHRLLRPGGELAFLGTHQFATVCAPPDGSIPISFRLEQPYFGMRRQDWRDAVDEPGGIEFNLTFSDWLRLFRETGFEVLDLIEVQAPDDAEGMPFVVPADWAKQYPSEHVWWLRKR